MIWKKRLFFWWTLRLLFYYLAITRVYLELGNEETFVIFRDFKRILFVSSSDVALMYDYEEKEYEKKYDCHRGLFMHIYLLTFLKGSTGRKIGQDRWEYDYELIHAE